jgi:hypothetical protein
VHHSPELLAHFERSDDFLLNQQIHVVVAFQA